MKRGTFLSTSGKGNPIALGPRDPLREEKPKNLESMFFKIDS